MINMLMQLVLVLTVSSFYQHCLCLGVNYSLSTEYNNCSIQTTETNISESILKFVSNGKRMVKFNVEINGDTGYFFETDVRNALYRPHDWILTTDETARHLLTMLEDFVPRSIWTLSYGVGNIQLRLHQVPANCTTRLRLSEVQHMIQQVILKNLSNNNALVPENVAVCNREIIESQIKYNCCRNYEGLYSEQMKCRPLMEENAVNIFKLVKQLTVYFSVLFCILLIPTNPLFLIKKSFKKFRVESSDSFQARNWKTQESEADNSCNPENNDDEQGPLLQNFGDLFTYLDNGTSQSIKLNGEISVCRDQLLQEDENYYSAFKFFWNLFISLKFVSVLEINEQKQLLKNLKWFKTFRSFYIRIVMIVLGILPLLFIYLFYFEFGKPIVDYDRKVSKVHNIALNTPEEIKLVLIVNPEVDLCIYVVAFLIFYLLEKISNGLKESFFKAIDKSLKYTHMFFNKKITDKIWDKDRNKYVNTFLYVLYIIATFLPLVKFIVLQVLFCWSLIIVKHLKKCKNNDQEDDKKIDHEDDEENKHEDDKKNKPEKMSVKIKKMIMKIIKKEHEDDRETICACFTKTLLLSIWEASSLFLFLRYVMTIALYIVNFIIYFLLGCLLHFDELFKYMAFIILCCVYGYNCFNGVTETYRLYVIDVRRFLYTQYEPEMSKVVQIDDEDTHVKSAYFLPKEADQLQNDNITVTAKGNDSVLIKVPRLLLFIENNNGLVKYIPMSLIDDLMSSNISPGKPIILYLKACRDFGLVFAFLLYIYMGIFAVGEAHDLESGVQTLVGLSAGFLPFALKNFVFKKQDNKLSGLKTDPFLEKLLKKKIYKFKGDFVLLPR